MGENFKSNSMKIRFPKYLIYILTVLNIFKSYSQERFIPLQEIEPPTSIGEFQNYEGSSVSHFKGIVDIKVPIYSIEQDGVSVPIELNYYSKGIQVNQEASWVGLGWNLNFSSITQKVNDEDDLGRYEDGGFYYSYLLPHPGFTSPFLKTLLFKSIHNSSLTYGSYSLSSDNEKTEDMDYYISTDKDIPLDGELYSTEGIHFPTSLYPIPDIFAPVGYGVDTEPDIFTVNLFGKSIKFFFNFENNNLEILNEKLYKIEYDDVNEEFTVTSPEEIKYIFGLKVDQGYASSSPSFDNAISSSSSFNPFKEWLITKIVTPSLTDIDFKYSYTGEVLSPPLSENPDLLGYNCTQAETKFDSPTTTYNIPEEAAAAYDNYSAVGPASTVGRSISTYYGSKYYLEKINFKKGSLNFNLGAREDISAFNLDPFRKVDNIYLKDFNGNTIFDYRFNYSLFTSNSDGNHWKTPKSVDLIRLRLDSIQINDQIHRKFIYNEIQLPAKTSYGTDYWGGYNGEIFNNSYVPNPKRFLDAGVQLISEFQEFDNGNNHSAHSLYSKAAMLEEIILPNGGKEKFTYELNQYLSNADNKVPNISDFSTIIKGGGLRIKKIEFYDSDGQTVLSSKSFLYDSGLLPIKLNFFKSYSVKYAYRSGTTNFIRRSYPGLKASQNNLYQGPIFDSDISIGYNKVTEQFNNIEDSMKSYKVEYTYENHPFKYSVIPTISFNYNYSAYTPALHDRGLYSNGTLLETKYFNELGDLIKTIKFDYKLDKSNLTYGINTGFIENWITKVDAQPNYIAGTSRHSIVFYPIYFDGNILSTKETTEFFMNGDSISSKEEYLYDSYNRLTTKIFRDNAGEESHKIETAYSYPDVSSSNFLLNSPRSIIVKNFYNTINSSVYAGDYKKLYYSKKDVDVNGTVGNQYNLDLEKSYSQYVHLGINQEYYTNKKYNLYDDSGNLLEYQIGDNPPEVLIYGYNDSYVIAKIKNISYNDVPYSLIQELKDLSNLDIDEISETNFINALNNFRDNPIFNNSTLETFTYDPLIGVSSYTDPKGIISYYSYDDMNRLKYLKDQNGNILKEFCYNNKLQPSDCALAAIPLTKPTGLTKTGSTSSSINFSWEPVTGASGYQIFKNGAFVSTSINTSGSISGLLSATSYNIQILAFNENGESPLSDVVTMSTQQSYTNRGTVTNRTGRTISAGTMKIFANGSQMASLNLPALADGESFEFSTNYSNPIYNNGTFKLQFYSPSTGITSSNYFNMMVGSSSTNGYFTYQGWGYEATVTSPGAQYSLYINVY